MEPSDRIRVLIADDHPMWRDALRSALEKEPALWVVGEVGEGGQVEARVRQWKPDVLVLDVHMPDLEPVLVVQRLLKLYPDLDILVLTADEDYRYVEGLLSAGATGYVLKTESPANVLRAVLAAGKGEPWYSQRIARQLADRALARGDEAPEMKRLTARQREVLSLIGQGLSNNEIAKRLFITLSTVKSHVSAIYSALGLDSRTKLMRHAIEHGIADSSLTKQL